MTHLEIILIIIIWIAYGVFAAYQTYFASKPLRMENGIDDRWVIIGYILFAPIVLIVKAIYGIFKKYEL